MSETTTPVELQRIYEQRFTATREYRDRVWRTLTAEFFQRYIGPSDTLLDLGCGYGEFINNIRCAKKYAMDLNPKAAEHLGTDVLLIPQDCSRPWNVAKGSIDTIFTSNFFEHLPSKDALGQTIAHAAEALRDGGLLIAMGPNIRVINGSYWDFWDHHLALSDRSLVELLGLHGFKIREVYPKFLPYTLVGAPQYPLWLLQIYLRFRVFWRLFGGQFLVIANR